MAARRARHRDHQALVNGCLSAVGAPASGVAGSWGDDLTGAQHTEPAKCPQGRSVRQRARLRAARRKQAREPRPREGPPSNHDGSPARSALRVDNLQRQKPRRAPALSPYAVTSSSSRSSDVASHAAPVADLRRRGAQRQHRSGKCRDRALAVGHQFRGQRVRAAPVIAPVRPRRQAAAAQRQRESVAAACPRAAGWRGGHRADGARAAPNCNPCELVQAPRSAVTCCRSC